MENLKVTEEQILGWEKEHGEVIIIEVAEQETELDPYMVEADLEEQSLVACYLKQPDDKVMNLALTKLPMFLEAGKVIVKSCWLGGDDRLRNDNDFLNAAAMQAAALIRIRQGRLKKSSKSIVKSRK